MPVAVKVPAFEGPLDLLLHLIDKNEIDIYDIPIYEITRQYLECLDEWNRQNMEIASEFIVMAATLINIKARMLLPTQSDSESEEDPREELIRRLIEYKQYKEAAQIIKLRIPAPERLWVERAKEKLRIQAPKPTVEALLNGCDLDELYALYKMLMQQKRDSFDPLRASFRSVAKDTYTVQEKIRDLMDTLKRLEEISFNQLRSQSRSRQETITYFLAMLEMNRSSLVYLRQAEHFADIKVTQTHALSEEEEQQWLEKLANEEKEVTLAEGGTSDE